MACEGPYTGTYCAEYLRGTTDDVTGEDQVNW